MPEQLTRHPDVTLEVLKSAGARCGEGAAQAILKGCPRERFCVLPGGEVCVYGLPEARTMTQIKPAELVAAAGNAAPVPAAAADAAAWPWLSIGVAFGIVIGALAVRRLPLGK